MHFSLQECHSGTQFASVLVQMLTQSFWMNRWMNINFLCEYVQVCLFVCMCVYMCVHVCGSQGSTSVFLASHPSCFFLHLKKFCIYLYYVHLRVCVGGRYHCSCVCGQCIVTHSYITKYLLVGDSSVLPPCGLWD